MTTTLPIQSMPLTRRFVTLAVGGALGGLFAALVLGEPLWYLLKPKPVAPVELAAPRLPAEKSPLVAVSLSPRVGVYPGGKNTFAAAVARKQNDKPVAITFEFAAPGLMAEPITVPVEATVGIAELVCAADVRPGIYHFTAQAGNVTATAKVEVFSPASPRSEMSVSVSPRVQVYQRGKNTGTVRVARSHFADPVTVTFTDLPADVRAAPVTVPADTNQATFELTADLTARPGQYSVTVLATAPGVPRATASVTVEIVPALRAPVDVVIVQDITGSMRKELAGVRAGLLPFAKVLTNSLIDLRLGFVGFKDTTLGQPLKVLQVYGQVLTADFQNLLAEVENLTPRGGGLEGSSCLDGLAEAAAFPFRTGAQRVLVLVTDDGPKRPDGRIKSIEEAAELLQKQKIDQLHIVTLPELKDALAPLWEGAKGKFFSLTAKGAAREQFDAILLSVGRGIAEQVELPVGQPEPAVPAPPVVIAPTDPVMKPVPPPSPEPPVPEFAPDPPPEPVLEPEPQTESTEGRPVLAVLAWLIVVVAGVGTAVFFAPRCANLGATGGVVMVTVLAGGALLAIAFGNPTVTRLGSATALGLGCGFGLTLTHRRQSVPAIPMTPPVAPQQPAHKPVIVGPKKLDGCPGCGRYIPGDPGSRYCMLCDQTF